MSSQRHSTNKPADIPAWLGYAGQLLLLVFLCSRLVTDKLADVAGQLLVLITLCALVARAHPLRQSVILKLFSLALAVQLISWGLSHLLTPELAERSPKLERLAAWFFLIPVALFIGNRFFVDRGEQRVLCWWAIALSALLLTPWLGGGGWEEIRQGLSGARVSFGITNAQHTGMLFGLALLGTAIFLPRVRRHTRARGRPWLALPYALLIIACAVGVAITQTRGVWLGLLVTGPGLALIFMTSLHPERQRAYLHALRQTRWRVRFTALVAVVMMGVFFGGIVLERIASEGPFVALDEERAGEPVLKENISVRLHTWGEALRWIGQRPLFGWGGKGRGLIVEATPELSALEKKRFGHLHSTYFDTLANYGVAGLLLWLGLLYWLTGAVYRAWEGGRLADDFLWFWLAFLLYWLVVNMFESFMYYQTGLYAFALIPGGYLALTTRNSPADERAGANDSGA